MSWASDPRGSSLHSASATKGAANTRYPVRYTLFECCRRGSVQRYREKRLPAQLIASVLFARFTLRGCAITVFLSKSCPNHDEEKDRPTHITPFRQAPIIKGPEPFARRSYPTDPHRSSPPSSSSASSSASSASSQYDVSKTFRHMSRRSL